MKIPLAAGLLALALPVRAQNALDALRQSAGPAPALAEPKSDKEPVPIDDAESKLAGDAEGIRRQLLSAALPKVQDLIQGITMGNTDLYINAVGDPVPLHNNGENAAVLATYRAAQKHLSLRPKSLDWLNDPTAAEGLQNLKTVARLMAENLAKTLPKVKSPVADGPAVARNEGTRVVVFPEFWQAHTDLYPSPRCAGIILTHEYFHHLVVNPEETRPLHVEKVFHGQPGLGIPTFPVYSMAFALHDAYSLTSFTVRLALNEVVECVPGWKPQTPAKPAPGKP